MLALPRDRSEAEAISEPGTQSEEASEESEADESCDAGKRTELAPESIDDAIQHGQHGQVSRAWIQMLVFEMLLCRIWDGGLAASTRLRQLVLRADDAENEFLVDIGRPVERPEVTNPTVTATSADQEELLLVNTKPVRLKPSNMQRSSGAEQMHNSQCLRPVPACTAYQLFHADQHAGKGGTKACWSELSDEKRSFYKEEALLDRERFKRETQVWAGERAAQRSTAASKKRSEKRGGPCRKR